MKQQDSNFTRDGFPGHFVMSLDFELMWGVRDVASISDYGDNIRGVHSVLPKVLATLKRFGVSATFATVGFLLFQNKSDLLRNLPEKRPQYSNPNLSPYNGYLDSVGHSMETDPYHFGFDIVQQIIASPNQELASHTFSHYYCLEDGQTVTEFEADLVAATRAAQSLGLLLKSMVFPRNQYNPAYLDVCLQNGITSFRGNENAWIYKPRLTGGESRYCRAVRLMDAYLNISGHHCHSRAEMKDSFPFNIASSRLLRPYNPKLRMLENFKIKRIKDSMTFAAIHGLTYHLWWHPHNFGIHQTENLRLLERVLSHYRELSEKYGFRTDTMSSLSQELESV